MNLIELNRALKQLRLGGMAAVLRAHDKQLERDVAAGEESRPAEPSE